MTTYRNLPALRGALDAESWEYLQDNWPTLAAALRDEIKAGASPGDIRRFVMTYSGRPALAARMEQAAAHLAAMEKQA